MDDEPWRVSANARDDLADGSVVADDGHALGDGERLIVVEVSGGDDLIAAAWLIDVVVHARARLSEVEGFAGRER